MSKKKHKKTGNAFVDGIHAAQEDQNKTDGRNVRVVMSDGMMAIKPVKGKRNARRPK
jgi:hypothetical protein